MVTFLVSSWKWAHASECTSWADELETSLQSETAGLLKIISPVKILLTVTVTMHRESIVVKSLGGGVRWIPDSSADYVSSLRPLLNRYMLQCAQLYNGNPQRELISGV